MDEQDTPVRYVNVPEKRGAQCAPPSAEESMVPPSPTIRQALPAWQVTVMRYLVVPEARCTQ
jgi:hypothetical protein